MLANAPRLLCLPGGSQPLLVLANAPRLLCLLEDPNLFTCSLMHLVYVSVQRIPVYFVLTNAPRQSWVGPNIFLCSPMHLVCSVCQRVPTSCMCSPMHNVCCVFWKIQICFPCSLMHLVYVSVQGSQFVYCAHQCTTSILDGPKSIFCAR